MASSPITAWQIDGETMETVSDFIFLGSKITADGDSSHEIKRYFWKKSYDKPWLHMTNLENRDITLPTKVRLVKDTVFLIVTYGCEIWTIKKAVCQRTDASDLWCWRRLLGVPWTARSNQSVLKEINLECSLEGLMLKLKLQYLGHLMQRINSSEKTLMLGKVEGRRRRGLQRMSWLDGITGSWTLANSGRWWEIGKPGMLQSLGFWRVGHDLVTKQQHGI